MKEIKITQLRLSTGQSYEQRKISKLMGYIRDKMDQGFTGEIKINFHNGNFSTKLGVKVSEKL